MIETLNESGLHRVLKALYAEQSGGTTEARAEGKICDIITPSGAVIEIQTAGVSRLAPKLARLLPSRAVTVVYPYAEKKIIRTLGAGGAVLSERASPKKLTVYSVFREVTGIYPFLFHPHFRLEALPVRALEIRERTETPVQARNNRRRRLRPWLTADKLLTAAGESRVFAAPEDYLALLPFPEGAEFTVRSLRASAGPYASYMAWVLEKCGLIRCIRKDGQARVFTRQAPARPHGR